MKIRKKSCKMLCDQRKLKINWTTNNSVDVNELVGDFSQKIRCKQECSTHKKPKKNQKEYKKLTRKLRRQFENAMLDRIENLSDKNPKGFGVEVKRGTGIAESGMRNQELPNPECGIRNAELQNPECGIRNGGKMWNLG